MALTFGDLIDRTNTARRETELLVVDGSGATWTVEQVETEVNTDGAVTDVKLTIAPAV